MPVLGICYGMQLGAQILGGQVRPAASREYGRAKLTVTSDDPLVAALPKETTVWMSHGDQVQELPADFVALATTPTCPYAAARHATRAVLRRPVPPRGDPHAAGGGAVPQLPVRHLRL